MFIFKNRDSTENWIVWHKDFGSATNNGLYLNGTNSQFSAGSNWLTAIDSNTISITSGQVGSAGAKVCYSFASIEGYSKVGSFSGNNSSNGTFVYTGFRPAWVIVKASNKVENWFIFDNKRDTFNVADHRQVVNTTGTESDTLDTLDFLSNGIKFRTNNTAFNGSYEYIYLAFAESPFKFANAR